MKEGLEFILNLLKFLDEEFKSENATSNLTRTSNNKLLFSFMNDGHWQSFFLLDEDLNKNPKELIEEIKKDIRG